MIKEKALLLLNKRASSNGVRSRTLQFLLSAYSANVTVPPLLDDNGAIASSPLSERSPEFPPPAESSTGRKLGSSQLQKFT